MKLTNQTHTIDPVSDKFVTVFEEYTKVHLATWSSKQMLRRIRQDVSFFFRAQCTLYILCNLYILKE